MDLKQCKKGQKIYWFSFNRVMIGEIAGIRPQQTFTILAKILVGDSCRKNQHVKHENIGLISDLQKNLNKVA